MELQHLTLTQLAKRYSISRQRVTQLADDPESGWPDDARRDRWINVGPAKLVPHTPDLKRFFADRDTTGGWTTRHHRLTVQTAAPATHYTPEGRDGAYDDNQDPGDAGGGDGVA